MRQTTKIIIGIISSIFALALFFLIGFSCSERRNWEGFGTPSFSVSQENRIEIETGSFRTVSFEVLGLGHPSDSPVYLSGELCIRPVSEESGKQSLSVPEEVKEYLKLSIFGDTLLVSIDQEAICRKIKTEYKPDENHKSKRLHLIKGLNLFLNTSIVDVINKTNFQMTVQDQKTDRVKLRSNSEISIVDCDITDLQFANNWRMTTIKNCKIRNLNLDLDETKNWRAENSEIHTGNLSGGSRHDNVFPKGMVKEINWYPKHNDARLNLSLEGDSAKIVFADKSK